MYVCAKVFEATNFDLLVFIRLKEVCT